MWCTDNPKGAAVAPKAQGSLCRMIEPGLGCETGSPSSVKSYTYRFSPIWLPKHKVIATDMLTWIEERPQDLKPTQRVAAIQEY